MKNNFDKCLEMLLDITKVDTLITSTIKVGWTNLGVTKRVYDKWIGRESTEQEMRGLNSR